MSAAKASSCTGSSIVKYAPFTSSVDIGFWHQFTKKKLEEYKLNVDPVEITGSYVNNQDSNLAPRLSVLYNTFDRAVPAAAGARRDDGRFPCPGLLLHTNTAEEFRACNRKQLLSTSAAHSIWQHMVSGEAVTHPQILSTFILHLFADLKKYHYCYWFAFPAFISHTETLLAPVQSLRDEWTQQQMSNMLSSYHSRSDTVDGGYFVLEHGTEDAFLCHPLTEYKRLLDQKSKVYLCIADPSSVPGVPGWPLRNLLTLAYLQWPSELSHSVLCLRQPTRLSVTSIASSLLLQVKLGHKPGEGVGDTMEPPPCVGWEKDNTGNMNPVMLDLSKTMDPQKLSDQACELTLQLMRWRVVPSLDINIMQSTRCLLLGAGTLGCNVARGLLGWGITHMTFVDSGSVSYSNPVRQSLYGFADCHNGGRKKAGAAAEALRLIRPSVVSSGVHLTIPMPGHSPGPSRRQEVLDAVQRLQDLVGQHDVIFLLTDSRESRWLPSLLAASQNKLVITAALGFDSFVVIRHGSKTDRRADAPAPGGSSCSTFDYAKKLVPGQHLGCYFCNDVVVPSNSQQDRSLDQQCTVSRPGISMMAAAEAVELMASVLQHSLGMDAPSGPDSSEGVLGCVYHSIRYFMSSHQLITPVTPAFKQCSACGQQILSRYEEEGTEMLLKVFDSSDYLEKISGISELRCLSSLEAVQECASSFDISESEEES